MRLIKVIQNQYIVTNEVNHLTEVIAEEWYMVANWIKENPDLYFIDSSVRDKTCKPTEDKKR